jgi:ligand-binding SRPBCC domain-containing protein
MTGTPARDETITFHRVDDGAWELHSTQMLPGRRAELFPFFANAENLERITPPAMGFRILTPLPIAMREGALIDYQLRLNGLPLRWRTRISLWNPPEVFVDEQLRGPYAEWVHTHRFTDDGDYTRMEDRVRFRLPFGALGRIVLPIVKRQLRGIFSYRREVLPSILAAARSDRRA